MKAIALFGAALAVAAWAVLSMHPGPQPDCNQTCRNDIAAATYFAINQLDCDGQTGDGGCGSAVTTSGANGAADELQDLGRSPIVESVTTAPRTGIVTVRVGVFFASSPAATTPGGQLQPTTYFDVRFLPDGQWLSGS